MDLVRSIVARLRLWRNGGSFEPDLPPPAAHIELGLCGERLAAKHLRRNGYKVLYHNFRAPKGGEVDIVCRDIAEKTLVFVEVKTRSSLDFGRPITAVDRQKQYFIARGAMAWLRLLDNPDVAFRFDVVEVVLDGDKRSINIVRNAFVLPKPYVY